MNPTKNESPLTNPMQVASVSPLPSLDDIIAGAHDDATLLNCLEDVYDDKNLPLPRRDELVTKITDRFNQIHPRGEFGVVAPAL